MHEMKSAFCECLHIFFMTRNQRNSRGIKGFISKLYSCQFGKTLYWPIHIYRFTHWAVSDKWAIGPQNQKNSVSPTKGIHISYASIIRRRNPHKTLTFTHFNIRVLLAWTLAVPELTTSSVVTIKNTAMRKASRGCFTNSASHLSALKVLRPWDPTFKHQTHRKVILIDGASD